MTEPAPRRVLVIGAAGVFGERLVVGILKTTALHVVAAGRDLDRLHAFIARMPGGTGRITAMALDARHLTATDLRASEAFVVIDIAGPFQGRTYHVARTAIEAGLHYLDLADGRDFVAGFGSLDAMARAAGVMAVTGASSTPALSNAVLDAQTAGWRRIDRVAIAIAPGNRAPRGLSVVRAILSYAGRPIPVFTGGSWTMRRGWSMTVRPSFPGIGRRAVALADTPDLDIVPARFAVAQEAVFRAGLELGVLHHGLDLASLVVRVGLLRSLVPLAPAFRAVAAMLDRFGSDRGGMLVEAAGLDRSGDSVLARWSLMAEAGDGPIVPTLPALALLRAIADGRLMRPGAAACVGLLPLAAIEAEFSAYRIKTQSHVEIAPDGLYERSLGPAFSSLPDAVRRLHRPGWGRLFRGTATVDGAKTRLARAVAAVLGFPPSATDIAVTMDIVSDAGQERWTRRFGDCGFTSVLSAARAPGRLIERFGPLRFELDVLAGPDGVRGMPVRAWWLGPLRMPLVLGPVSIATETVDPDGRFCFDVELRLPLGLGRLVRYRGWLRETCGMEPPARPPLERAAADA